MLQSQTRERGSTTFMQGADDQTLIARVAAALARPNAELSLQAALEALEQYGIVPHVGDGREPWLSLEHGGRSLILDSNTEGANLELRDLLRNLLLGVLLRACSEDEQRRLRERADMLSSASFEGLLIHDEGVVIDANQRLAELVGYEPGELLGSELLERCAAPEEVARLRERIRERFEGTYVINAVRKDGSHFRAEFQSKQGKLGARPVRVCAVRDVTERERTSALLLESEARLRDLAQQAFDFIVFSRDGVVVEVTGPVEGMLGWKPSEWVGRRLTELAEPSSVPLLEQVLAEQRTGAYEMVILNRAGEPVPVEIVGLMSTLDAEPVRVGAVRDLREVRRLEHERRRLEAQLQRSQRLESLGVLAGGVAHDFNNLLVGVLGNAELLQDSLRGTDDRQLCDAIIGAARRASDLTSQLLGYAGQRDLGRRQPVDLGVLWRELCTLLGARISKQARIELNLEPGSVVIGDRATLTQMLMNLLTNASDALDERSGTIEISTSRVQEPDARWDHALGAAVGPGDWIMIEVRDTGLGMDSATLLRVFEPFFSTKDKGHGLGLASCLGIVAAHGGALSVDSEPGQGSRFSVLLPGANRSLSEAPDAPTRSADHPCRVLVIDDESVVRALLRRSLERRGYTVAEAADGQSGLLAIREAAPDLIMLDMNMPELDGAEVLRRIRADGLDMPVLIASGHIDTAMETRLTPGSFQGFLRKPFSVAELVSAIENALAS
jgi:two-component system, cell cycle sensor histidine kinase and response regulator CckA